MCFFRFKNDFLTEKLKKPDAAFLLCFTLGVCAIRQFAFLERPTLRSNGAEQCPRTCPHQVPVGQ